MQPRETVCACWGAARVSARRNSSVSRKHARVCAQNLRAPQGGCAKAHTRCETGPRAGNLMRGSCLSRECVRATHTGSKHRFPLSTGQRKPRLSRVCFRPEPRQGSRARCKRRVTSPSTRAFATDEGRAESQGPAAPGGRASCREEAALRARPRARVPPPRALCARRLDELPSIARGRSRRARGAHFVCC